MVVVLEKRLAVYNSFLKRLDSPRKPLKIPDYRKEEARVGRRNLPFTDTMQLQNTLLRELLKASMYNFIRSRIMDVEIGQPTNSSTKEVFSHAECLS